jgi:hypothetical protein
MNWLLIALFVVGSMASLAWYGARGPQYSRSQKRAYGLLALGCWVAILILANTAL